MMSTSLSARATALRERLTILDQTRSNAAEASELEGLRFELDASVAVLKGHIEKEAILRSAKIAVQLPTTLATTRKRAKGILEKFLLNGTVATLKKGQSWKALLNEISVASRDLGTSNTAAWQSHRLKIFAGDPPNSIQSRLAPTRENVDALGKYRILFEKLKAKFEALPPDRATIDEASQLARELETAAKAFNFAVPGDVKLFLEAVLSVSGAPLALLTPVVLKWLKENNSFENYRISSTGRG
jgi:hypothetical protein